MRLRTKFILWAILVLAPLLALYIYDITHVPSMNCDVLDDSGWICIGGGR